MQEQTRVQVKILDKDFQVACPVEERDALLLAAHELDKRMRQVRNSGAMVGIDRVAVMVALNLCHELNECKKNASEHSGDIPSDIKETTLRLSQKLTQALKPPTS